MDFIALRGLHILHMQEKIPPQEKSRIPLIS
jgi:hypothetical protein